MIQRTRLVELFCELVAIDSPSRGERGMADRLAVELTRLGFQVEEDSAGERIGGNCGNLYARLPGNLPMPPILFSCHMDTVEPGRGKHAIVGQDDVIRSGGDTILGADDLAGIAAVLEAIESLLEDNKPHRPLEILFSVAEEAHLAGIHCFEPERLLAREAYVLDTSGAPGLAVLQAPGHIALTFEIHGRAAHAGIDPENGISAISAAARGISRLHLGRIGAESTANIGRIEGGGETNVIADTCRVTAECRSLDRKQLVGIADQMKSHMEDAAREAGASIDFAEKASYLPYRIDAESPVVKRFSKVCGYLGLPVRLTATGGGSDNNVLALHGIEGIVIACGMNNVHSFQEQIRVVDLVDTARLVRGLIESD